MSRKYQEQFLKEQIQEYDQLLRDGASSNEILHGGCVKAGQS